MIKNTLSVFKNAAEVYAYLCQPICKMYGIQQPALDILYFLAKNPAMNTAVDIQKQEGVKQSMVSFHVDRLVNDGYLQRLNVPEDRRKIRLQCTEKAQPLIDECGRVREKLRAYMAQGITEEEGKIFEKVSRIIEENILRCREQMNRNELK